MVINSNFWNGKSVFITGHTGFKGGWLALWLNEMGAKVYGYSLEAPTTPNFYNIIDLQNKIQNSFKGDILDLKTYKIYAGSETLGYFSFSRTTFGEIFL